MTSAIESTTTEGIPEQGEAALTEPNEGAIGDGNKERTVLERVMEGGEFAREQIINRDTTISRQANQIKQFDAVDPYIRAAGGPEQLLNLASLGQQFQKVQQVPGLADFVQKSLSEGRVALPEAASSNDPEEEWMDEDTKRVRDELREEMAGFRQQLQTLSDTTNSASVRSQESHIQKNIASVVDLFNGTEEGKQEALDLIQKRVEVANQQAIGGNASQRAMIDQLAGPEGGDVLQFMLMKEGLFKKYGAAIYGNGEPTTEEQVSTVVRSTDEMQTNPSRPGVPQLPPVPKGPVTQNTYANVLREIQRRRGRSV